MQLIMGHFNKFKNGNLSGQAEHLISVLSEHNGSLSKNLFSGCFSVNSKRFKR